MKHGVGGKWWMGLGVGPGADFPTLVLSSTPALIPAAEPEPTQGFLLTKGFPTAHPCSYGQLSTGNGRTGKGKSLVSRKQSLPPLLWLRSQPEGKGIVHSLQPSFIQSPRLVSTHCTPDAHQTLLHL